MGYARGRFGIEYNAAPRRDGDDVPWLLWTLGAVALVALVSFGVTVRNRLRDAGEDDAAERAAAALAKVVPPASQTAPSTNASAVAAPPPAVLEVPGAERRPAAVRNLLLRLETAERTRDASMAVSTIEQLRRLPEAADLDDALARRLGTLNVRLLFSGKPTPWVTTVEVRRGDAAERLARERGSTLASLAKLNPGVDLGRLHVGQKLRVMQHPRFSLAVRRKAQTVDLSLNGKFFRRYYLTGRVTGEPGAYELPANPRGFWTSHGIAFRGADRAELELLLPPGVSVLVSDY